MSPRFYYWLVGFWKVTGIIFLFLEEDLFRSYSAHVLCWGSLGITFESLRNLELERPTVRNQITMGWGLGEPAEEVAGAACPGAFWHLWNEVHRPAAALYIYLCRWWGGVHETGVALASVTGQRGRIQETGSSLGEPCIFIHKVSTLWGFSAFIAEGLGFLSPLSLCLYQQVLVYWFLSTALYSDGWPELARPWNMLVY